MSVMQNSQSQRRGSPEGEDVEQRGQLGRPKGSKSALESMMSL